MTDRPSPLDHVTTDQLLGTIPSGLFVVDREMRIVYWNPAAERITGFPASEAVGRHCSFLQGIPCGERCGLFDPAVRKPTIGGLCTIVGKDGRTVHLLKNIDHLYDSEGRVIGGIESFVDITRQRTLENDLRRQAEELELRVAARTEELARSEARLRAVLDTMDDLAYTANADYRITMMNRAMRDLYGNRTGETCHRVLHDQEQPCAWCVMDRVLRGETVREERPMAEKRRLYEIIHSPLAGEDGTIQKLAVCRDITERKQTEQQLRETNRELDAFTRSVSHDLRGLLAPVVTYMDFLRSQYGEVLDPQVLLVLGEVERQGERAVALVDDLLDLAQVGRVAAGDQLVDVGALIDEVLRAHAGEAGTPLPAVTVAPLPPIPLPETLAYQLFANLIGNALRYGQPASGPLEISCRELPERLVYVVRDHGPGIPAGERTAIFDIFHRGTTAQGTRGTGVGLAIVRKIAHHCHGEVWVEETPGGGATFCFAIPRATT